MIDTLTRLVVAAAVCVAAACQSKGPAPGQELATERVDVTMAEPAREASPRTARDLGIPTEQHHRDYGASLHGSPHRPGGDLGAPGSHVSGDVKHVDVGALSFQAPDGWTYEHPASPMRRAELGVRAEQGTAGLVVYFFGNRGAGSANANVDRWVGQFQKADGTPVGGVEPTKRKVAGFEVTQVEVAGTYVGGMGAPGAVEPVPSQRMIATIVETQSGPYYFKFLGDDEVVRGGRDAFERLLASMKPSDG